MEKVSHNAGSFGGEKGPRRGYFLEVIDKEAN
jgi:hypothetical protein